MCRLLMVGLSAVIAVCSVDGATAGVDGQHWQHRVPGMHVISSGEAFKPTLGHVGFVVERPVRVGWDILCEPEAAVRRSVVDSTWDQWLGTQGLAVSGVGDEMLGERVRVPLRVRYNAGIVMVVARVADNAMMSTDRDMLCGTGMQEQMGLRIDSGMERLEVRRQGISIVTEELWVLRERMQGEPIAVLDLCASASTAYAVFRDMGWSIAEWHAVEPNGVASKVAEVAYGGRVKLICKRVEAFNCTRWYAVILAPPVSHRADWPRAREVSEIRDQMFLRRAAG